MLRPPALPSFTQVRYSVNQGPFNLSINNFVTLQKQDSILQYYFTKKNFDNSVVKTVMFPKHAKRFLNKISLNSSLIDSSLHINIVDKSSGVLTLEVYNMTGTKLIERSHFKDSDELAIDYALDNYSPGFYILTITYGKDLKSYKLVKE